MNRAAFESSALLLGLCLVNTAAAHHPPQMERCLSFTFTGQVEQVEWHNPHVELVIRAESGESHRVVWLNIQGLKRAGIDSGTLRAGDQVTVTVGTLDHAEQRPMLLAAITRASDGWEWSQPPQGC